MNFQVVNVLEEFMKINDSEDDPNKRSTMASTTESSLLYSPSLSPTKGSELHGSEVKKTSGYAYRL